MNLQKIYSEEDFFPREITSYEEREYGLLFYNEENKDSYDSNHALIFRDKIMDLDAVLDEIVEFYRKKGIAPNIYQSICDDGYLEENKQILAAHGFNSWSEPQKFMVLCEPNTIVPNPEITVRRVMEWDDEYAAEIFEKAGEPWEIGVAKNALNRTNTLFFVAYSEGKPVGMMHAHVTDGVCRVDYLLVAAEHRKKGTGRTLTHSFAEYCRANGIENCFLWPSGETAEKIYYEAGFRTVAVKKAGRASFKERTYPKEKPVLRFRKDGRFRILMMSDFHGKPDFNPKLTAGIEALVAHAEPDFVMLGGDQLCGIDPETLRTFLGRVMEPVQRRGIPWAHVYGNHDAEQPMTKEEMQPVYETFPLCLSEAGPEDISGVGNYCLTVLAADSDEPAYHLWALDSHSEVRDYCLYFNLPADTQFILPKHFGGGSVQASPLFDQVMWYYTESKRRETEGGRKIPAVMFMHVPIIEYNLLYRNPEVTGFIGRKREKICAGELNSGLFMACLQRGDVKGIFCGHEHLCDFQGEYCGITMAYDSCVGYDMSAHDDMRGGRVIDLYEDGRMETRHIKLMELLGEDAMRRRDFFEGGDKYYIRDID